MTRFLSMHKFALLAALLLVSAASALHAQTITTFDAPNSTMTVPQAINVFGQIAGYYQDANGFQLGFLRKRNGRFTSFEADQSSIHFPTFVTDINTRGEIIGYIYHPDGGSPAFLRQTDGTIVLFNGGPTSTPSAAIATEPVPRLCAGDNCVDGTGPIAINALGQITGAFGAGLYFGFLRQPDGTTIQFNVNPSSLPFTIPQAINLFGKITGYYLDQAGAHGFLRQPKGAIITFDAPNSTHTTPQSINLLGQITGYYQDANNVVHAFLRQPGGTIVTFDPVGSIGTKALAINLEGQITGFYATTDGTYHGFLRRPNGNIDSFDAPSAANAGTFPKDINDLGQIVGYYQDANFVLHGFVRSAR